MEPPTIKGQRFVAPDAMRERQESPRRDAANASTGRASHAPPATPAAGCPYAGAGSSRMRRAAPVARAARETGFLSTCRPWSISSTPSRRMDALACKDLDGRPPLSRRRMPFDSGRAEQGSSIQPSMVLLSADSSAMRSWQRDITAGLCSHSWTFTHAGESVRATVS